MGKHRMGHYLKLDAVGKLQVQEWIADLFHYLNVKEGEKKAVSEQPAKHQLTHGSRAEKVARFLAEQERGCTQEEIRVALGVTPKQAGNTIHTLCVQDVLVVEGKDANGWNLYRVKEEYARRLHPDAAGSA